MKGEERRVYEREGRDDRREVMERVKGEAWERSNEREKERERRE